MDWPGDGTLIVTCGGGAEEALGAELAELGIEILSRDNGTVRVRGAAREMASVNTSARTASRVLVPVAEGTVGSYDELYRLARRVAWQRLITPRQTLAVSAVTRDRALSDSRLAALTVKDAVVDAQRTGSGGTRSSIDRRALHRERERGPLARLVGCSAPRTRISARGR
ncbi:MAG: THUMP domain-containing protein [Spirochaetota bacterium]